ncbi:hypothetical protein MMC20_005533 [Loxospora ochrophaea]|nr:hypothetical protein [Loxospora ochrophaea]
MRSLRGLSSLQAPTAHLFSRPYYTRFHPSFKHNPFGHHRTFHASPQRQIFAPVSATILSLHTATGLPWALTLPLTALLVRVVLLGWPSKLHHRAIQNRLACQPLLSALKFAIRDRVMKQHAERGPKYCDQVVRREFRDKQRELEKRWHAQRWKLYLPILQLPVWLTVMETLRQMCGTHEGLLGLALRWFRGAQEQGQENSREALEALEAPAGVSVEQSFSSEGALWFPDLLVPDPQCTLPLILTGSLLVSLHFSERLWRRNGQSRSRKQRIFSNSMKIMALAIFPATLQVPSALLVYWISSAWLGLGQNVVLELLYPRPKTVTPCKPRKRRFLAPRALN